jgi:hypothetical protein
MCYTAWGGEYVKLRLVEKSDMEWTCSLINKMKNARQRI